MKAFERRKEIYMLLMDKRQITVYELMKRFDVSEKTIHRDIHELMRICPVKTIRGVGGGVKLEDWYRPKEKSLSFEQYSLLKNLTPSLKGSELKIMKSIFIQFAPNNFDFF